MVGQRTIIIDLDETICRNMFPKIGPFIGGAVDAIGQLQRARWKCVITSCRNNPSLYSYPEIRDWNLGCTMKALADGGIKKVHFDKGRDGKPLGKWWIDDRGLTFHHNWNAIIELVRKDLETRDLRSGHPLTICVGVEGCIFEAGALVNGSDEALRMLHEMGVRIVLSTIKSNRKVFDSARERLSALDELYRKLNRKNLIFHWLDDGTLGKPVADYYVETNIITFRGSWKSVLERILNGQPKKRRQRHKNS